MDLYKTAITVKYLGFLSDSDGIDHLKVTEVTRSIGRIATNVVRSLHHKQNRDEATNDHDFFQLGPDIRHAVATRNHNQS